MSRYNNNWGSHDQLQELRKVNMALHRELDEMKGRMGSMHDQIITYMLAVDVREDEIEPWIADEQ